MKYKFSIALFVIVLLIFLVSAIPQILVNSPSSSPFYTTNTSVELNFSITESSLGSLIYNWNSTNFTMYNDSLVLMMNFDNLSALGENSTYAVDVSKYGNNGTFENGATINSSGKYGKAIEFGSVNSDINIPDITFPGEFTISFWWNVNYDSTNAMALSRGSGGAENKMGHTSSNTRFYVRVLNGGTSDTTSAVLPSENEWHFITLVRDSSDKVDIIVDAGSPTRLFSNAAQSGDSLWSMIGTAPTNTPAQDLDGLMDEILFWNRSLSSNEIYQQYISNLNKFNSTQWNLYVNQSKNATTGLDYGTYTYQTFVTDLSENLTSTEQRTIKIQSDIIFPIWSLNSTNLTDSTTINNIVYFNITMNETNPDKYIFSWYNTTDWVNNSPASYTNGIAVSVTKTIPASSGTINWTWYFNDTVGNTNQTDVWSITLTPDTTYPSFSNYWDDNATLKNSGTAWFNVTVLNTNGTVWLSINNTNYTATNLTSNIYNVSINLTSAGTYNYTWYAYGNGSTNLLNNSEIRYYIVNASATATQTQTPVETPTPSSGGGGYFLEQNTKTNGLEMRTFISPNKSITTKIKDDKGTGIKEIELKAKNWISGKIFVVAYNETPDFCSINYQGEYMVYKVLDFNNTIKEDSIDSGRLKIGIQKDWVYSNNVSEIKFVRCYPQYEEVKSSYESETNKEGIYNVYISGFSAYAILGTLEPSNSSSEKIWNNKSKLPNLGKIFLLILIVALIIMVIMLLIKHRIYLKERIHNKFFDFEFKFKFRIGK